ncbi:MAG TPA: [Fe-Fe] hydrogenase large subunit C-terminal domain-containing protein [Clostridia bacterium]|nr:[Fe-Fe] hydrogenase large subunit C-terminal domain-containing protein [Clostridia bacterium]
MNFINFSRANCRNCYRCLRSCPVKAIQIKDEQANIIEDRCIACGHCLLSCPQDARNIRSDISEVRAALKSGRTVIASLAPSFAGAFDMLEAGQMAAALKQLGISIVEETAVGADIVTGLYREHMKEGGKANLITTCCPSANYLIEKYHPSLIQYMLPVASPMLAHGRLLKHVHSQEAYVVFIGPCVAKKAEAFGMQYLGSIDAVLTFEELNQWFLEEGIDIKSLVPDIFSSNPSSGGRRYPVSGGVLDSISGGDTYGYTLLRVDGFSKCMKVFQALEMGLLNNTCVEVSICEGSCLGGPGMPKDNMNYFKYYQSIREHAAKAPATASTGQATDGRPASISFSKSFFDKSLPPTPAAEEELSRILQGMGKFTPSDELNCGACGYNSCREKAKAVIDGMAEMSMCLPYMRSKAESMTNIIFDQSPNIIMLIDEDLNIKEFNPTAERLLKVSAQEAKDRPIDLLMDDSGFAAVVRTKTSIYKQKLSLMQHGLVFMTNLVYLEKQKLILAIMTDITLDEKHQEELARVKQNTLEAAQKVITKQMRVAQEIAGLLGETTAETKVILTKLKEIVVGEAGDME